jgi:hypothetical protein
MKFCSLKPKAHLVNSMFKYLLSLSFVFFGFSVQATPVSSLPTGTVKGRAPVVLEVLINNQSAPGKPPSPDSILQGTYKYSDEDGDIEEGTRFQWKREGTEISGATSVNYTVQPLDDNQELTLQIIPGSVATADPDTGYPITSVPLQVSSSPPTASSVFVSGLNVVGNPLTANYTYDDPNGDVEGQTLFKWFRNATQIPGVTSSTYNSTLADEGSVIAFEVTPVSLTGGLRTGVAVRSADSPVISTIEGSAPEIRSATVIGEAVIGGSVSLDYEYFDADGDLEGNSGFQWQTNESGSWVDIKGETDHSYVLRATQENTQVRAILIPVSRTGAPSMGPAFTSSSSETVLPSSGSAPVATSVIETGTRMVGQTLTGSYVYNDADGDAEGATTTQWMRGCNGMSYCIPIPGATGLTYTLQVEDEGAYVLFQVIPKALTGTPATGKFVNAPNREKIAPQPGSAPVATNVIVTGSFTVGQTLNAKYSYSDADGDLEGASTYQWYRGCYGFPGGCIAIPNATGLTYTLQKEDEGALVFFRVIPKSSSGTPSTGQYVDSPNREKIAPQPGSAPVATNVIVTGARTVGQTLTAKYSYSDADGDLEGASTFEWWRGCNGMSFCTKISGETGLTYNLQKEDEGAYIFFRVIPQSRTGTPSTGAKADSAFENKITPMITNLRVEKPTATRGSFEVFYDFSGGGSGTATYQWYWRGSPITNATKKTHAWGPPMAPSAAAPEELSVVVTPRSQGGVTGNGATAKISLKSPFHWGAQAPLYASTWQSIVNSCTANTNGQTIIGSTQEMQQLVRDLGNLLAYGVDVSINYWSSSNGTASNSGQKVRLSDGFAWDSVNRNEANGGICINRL